MPLEEKPLFISKSKKMMNPLQVLLATVNSDAIAHAAVKAYQQDPFSLTYSLIEVTASMILNMKEQGKEKEVEALLADFVGILRSQEEHELIRLPDETDQL